MVDFSKGVLKGYNRNGFALSISQILADELMNLRIKDFQIDGEIVGDTYYAFDLVTLKGQDISSESFYNRHLLLNGFGGNQPNLIFAPLAVTEQAKRELYHNDGITGLNSQFTRNKSESKTPRKWSLKATIRKPLIKNWLGFRKDAVQAIHIL